MAYYSSAFPRHSARNHFVKPVSILDRLLALLPCDLAAFTQQLWDQPSLRIQRIWRRLQHRFHLRAILNLPNLCILLWIVVLLWGERWVFSSSIIACKWAGWENWVSFPVVLGAAN
jgi:ethanolamine phosphate phosphodiesterase